VVITCLRGDDAELEVVSGPNGLLHAARKGTVHVTLTTLSPVTAEALGHLHQANGTRYLCCQMQGRAQAAETGQLLLWASGQPETLSEVRALLETFAARICYLGLEVDRASAAKLAVNMLMFANIELFAETSNYLQRCNIDPKPVFDLLTNTVFSSPLFKGITASLSGDHVSDGTTVGSSLVDLELLLDHARSVQAGMPTVQTVAERYAKTMREGHGALAQSAVLLSL
jgi:3-hydroxyisobutyrate dehydrogenase-like beta-hydroxyacid dehydrogenase